MPDTLFCPPVAEWFRAAFAQPTEPQSAAWPAIKAGRHTLIAAVRQGELDRVRIPERPLDVLAQQLVAEVACREYGEDELYALVRRAWPYRELPRAAFDAVVRMLAEGTSVRQGRSTAHLHRDAVNHRLRARRGARLAAITNGGTIPDNADYHVVLEPEGHFIGTVNEDFAVESMAGDIFQLGNHAYRIQRIESGRVRVEDAQGQPPNIPFWLGEAPARSDELSHAVSRLRAAVAGRDDALGWLTGEVGVARPAAEQLVAYIKGVQAVFGTVPTADHVVLERFFDEAGGMQLVIHAPFGSRINRAWGLALRKRMCRKFNFELQAAATEDAIVLSLTTTHSFPLDEIAHYLKAQTVRPLLIQALLDAPMFTTRWRWNATVALALQRMRGGKRVPTQLQRMQAEDLVGAVFPDQRACLENIAGDREIPDHPLVEQTLADCLTEAMDIDGLERLLAGIADGTIAVTARDLPEPSPLAHEILNARPYAFLDDAPLEERRTQAVASRRWLDPETAADLGRLDAAAIARVRAEAWPQAANADELHDALVLLGFLTAAEAAREPGWERLHAELAAARRATVLQAGRVELWAAAERLPQLLALFADDDKAAHPTGRSELARDAAAAPRAAAVAAIPAPTASAPRLIPPITAPPEFAAHPWTRETALVELLRGRLEALGPVRAADLAEHLGLAVNEIEAALLALEAEGCILRGRFTPEAAGEEWCERRLLARIHRYTLKRLRQEIEPVSAADFLRFLFAWQRLTPETRGEGPEALAAAVEQLEGFEAPAAAWEGDLLPARVADYAPEWLDSLCLSGRVLWARLTPPRSLSGLGARSEPGGRARPNRSASEAHSGAHATRERDDLGRSPTGAAGASQVRQAAKPAAEREHGSTPVRATPIALLGRSRAGLWQSLLATAPAAHSGALSRYAERVAAWLEQHGASFFDDLVHGSGQLRTQAEAGLAELVAAGRVTADSFKGLRALLVPADKRRPFAGGRRRHRTAAFGVEDAGRWSLTRLYHRPSAAPADPRAEPVGAAPSQRSDSDSSRRGAAPTAALIPHLSPQRRREALATSSSAPVDVEAVARVLLRRYGVMFRRLLEREGGWLPTWRELVLVYRRLEARGEIRGGRFVGGVSGEQYALPEAVGALRAQRRAPREGLCVSLSAADPLNLVGILTPGAKVPALAGNRILFRDGVPVAAQLAGETRFLETVEPEAEWALRNALVRRAVPPELRSYLR